MEKHSVYCFNVNSHLCQPERARNKHSNTCDIMIIQLSLNIICLSSLTTMQFVSYSRSDKPNELFLLSVVFFKYMYVIVKYCVVFHTQMHPMNYTWYAHLLHIQAFCQSCEYLVYVTVNICEIMRTTGNKYMSTRTQRTLIDQKRPIIKMTQSKDWKL